MQKFLKHIILPLLLIILFQPLLIAQNLINNPGFENGITGWSDNMNNGANASFNIETSDSPEGSKHFKCEVTKLGNNDWDVQLRSNEFAVDQTHSYRLTFKAKSKASGAKVKVYIQSNKWMGQTFSLTDNWKSYSYDFYPDESTKQLKFNFTEITDYAIDDIVLEDITTISGNFNTPPSCVVTAPHVNAYFKVGSEVTINAYATDIGGTGNPGEVEKVEFYVDDQKIGESASSNQNNYTLNWDAVSSGEYRLTAIAIDTLGKTTTSAGVMIHVGNEDVEAIGLSAGKGKYLGNVVRNAGVEPTFTNYWNGVTSGNGGKWQTVERNRNVMNWEKGDEAYNLAKNNHLPYRYHTLAWGSQYPEWIKTLAPADFQSEMEEFIQAVANRYPYIDQIDVINEVLPGHQADTKYFIDGLGGKGDSGYDWAIWLFKKAREYFPNSKLVLNDFAMINSASNIRKQMELLKVLRDSALVDGFGAQAHTFNLDNMQANDLKENLHLMATAGVPIYITEMDMQGKNTDEASQLISYQNLFPVLWEHPAVAGITFWGYIYGNMWKPNAGLVNANGSERSGMTWLKNYMDQQQDVGYPFGFNASTLSLEVPSFTEDVKVYPNPSDGRINVHNPTNENLMVEIYDIYGRTTSKMLLGANGSQKLHLSEGIYIVKTENQKNIKLWVK